MLVALFIAALTGLIVRAFLRTAVNNRPFVAQTVGMRGANAVAGAYVVALVGGSLVAGAAFGVLISLLVAICFLGAALVYDQRNAEVATI